MKTFRQDPRRFWTGMAIALAGLATVLIVLLAQAAVPDSSPAYAEGEPGIDTEGVGPSAVELGSIVPFVTETGFISASIDGLGTNSGAGGTIQVDKPSGATVRGAYMAAASTGFGGRVLANGDVKIDGVGVNWDISTPSSISSYNHWSNVTALVKPKIDAAPAGLVSFLITEVSTLGIDGEILAVIFDDPNQTTSNTVILLFGAQAIAGDTFNIGLAQPLDKSDANLVLDMSLGISYGWQGVAQVSLVDVNGTRMTSSAGGQDDGVAQNGALMTAGGIGDTNANPPPFASPSGVGHRIDDELYDLLPFVATGDTNISVFTRNPSNDDNILFAALLLSSTTAIVGEGIVLGPATATNDVGTQHTVTATVQDDDGNPVVGRDVTFTIVSGPHTGLTGTVPTDAGGQATFTYTGTAAGVDTIVATFVDSQGQTQTSNQVTKEWVRTQEADLKKISLEAVGPAEGPVSEQIPFEVIQVLHNNGPLAGPSGLAIPYLDTGYRYKVVSPANSGLGAGFESGAEPAGFADGAAGFGTVSGACPLNATAVNTTWPANTDILLRKALTLPAGASNLKVSVAIDNDVQVFINGTDISGGVQVHENCATQDSFVFTAPDGILNTGGNLLAVRGIDRGVIAYLDVRVTFDPPPAASTTVLDVKEVDCPDLPSPTACGVLIDPSIFEVSAKAGVPMFVKPGCVPPMIPAPIPVGPFQGPPAALGLVPGDCFVVDSVPGVLKEFDVKKTFDLPVSVPVQDSTIFDIHCLGPSLHTVTIQDEIRPSDPAVTDPDLTNNAKETTYTIACIAKADLKVTSATVTCDDPVDVNTAFNCTVENTVHNNGPFGPVNADVIESLSAPAGCVLNPAGPQVEQGVSLPVSVPVVVSKTWSVTCSDRSFHTFSGSSDVQVDQLHVIDPDPTNNSDSGQHTISVFDLADLKVTVVAVDCDNPVDTNTNFTCRVDVSVHNNGPTTPVDAEVTFGLSVPVDCDDPADQTQGLLLEASIEQTVSKTFTTQCSLRSFHTFTGSGDVQVNQLHVRDPDPSNNSGSGQDTNSVFDRADAKVTGVTINCPATATSGSTFTCTVTIAVHNNGPLDPVDITGAANIGIAPGCDVAGYTPGGRGFSVDDVPVSVSVLVSVDFDITCPSGDYTIVGCGIVQVNQLHVRDQIPVANNYGVAATLVVVRSDPVPEPILPGRCSTVDPPEICGDGIDNDADTLIDEGPDTDGDGINNCEDLDDDGDGFSDVVEEYVGTAPLADCPWVVGVHPAWPPDFDDSQDVNIIDVLTLKPAFGSAAGDAGYVARTDLNADGNINIVDVLALKPAFGTSCN